MKTSITSNAALYGSGIFTTISIYDRKPTHWEKHWKRLTSNAAIVGIDISEYTEAAVIQALETTIHESKIIDARARITLFDERPSGLWPSRESSEQKTSLQILIGEKRPLPELFKLTTSPFPINSLSPLAGVKSCNYLEQILSIDESKGRGFHEAIRINERGNVTSGSMSNIFWLKGERLYTPSLATGCLAGTTREYVLENLDCEEVEAGLDELRSADAIYLTSAGLGIVQAAGFDSIRFKRSDHPMADLWTK